MGIGGNRWEEGTIGRNRYEERYVRYEGTYQGRQIDSLGHVPKEMYLRVQRSTKDTGGRLCDSTLACSRHILIRDDRELLMADAVMADAVMADGRWLMADR